MIDPNGLYVEQNGDGGDSANRGGVMAAYFVQTKQLDKAFALIDLIQKYQTVAPNTYIRYPINYNQPSDFSRDQASRLMLGFGLAGRKDLVFGYYKLLIKNGFKHPNGDYIGFGEINNIVRSLSPWYLAPVAWAFLNIWDLKFLGDIYFRKHALSFSLSRPFISVAKGPVWGYDTLICEDLYWSKSKFWTPISWLARKLYKKSDAPQQIWNNLINPAQNGCVEAGNALLDIFNRM